MLAGMYTCHINTVADVHVRDIQKLLGACIAAYIMCGGVLVYMWVYVGGQV